MLSQKIGARLSASNASLVDQYVGISDYDKTINDSEWMSCRVIDTDERGVHDIREPPRDKDQTTMQPSPEPLARVLSDTRAAS